MFRTLDLLSATLASTLRGWRGTVGRHNLVQPAQLPELYDREGAPECRLVREALTELNLDAMIFPCPDGGSRHLERLRELSGQSQVPFLYDPETNTRLSGAQAIVDYLFRQYRGRAAPAQLAASRRNLLLSQLATGLRLGAGVKARASKAAAQALTLYSFESSPYSRPVRELLCELELPYQLVNLSKQQTADMGPATFRLHRGPYQPLPNSKREAFLKRYGRVQVPFLVDPNTSSEIFESADILRYLKQTYASQ